MKVEKRFNIDFFEFAFLVEACIPPRPIARAMFGDKVIDYYHDLMTEKERALIYEWISKNWIYQDGIEKKNEDCLWFDARFNPENQYIVTTNYDNKEQKHICFKRGNDFCVKKHRFINNNFIIQAEKIKNELSRT